MSRGQENRLSQLEHKQDNTKLSPKERHEYDKLVNQWECENNKLFI